MIIRLKERANEKIKRVEYSHTLSPFLAIICQKRLPKRLVQPKNKKGRKENKRSRMLEEIKMVWQIALDTFFLPFSLAGQKALGKRLGEGS